MRLIFRSVFLDYKDNVLSTGIQVRLPAGLTRQEAINYVTGVVAGEVSRYAASEALGLGPITSETDWSEIVT
jgi:hypothetical protein